MTAINITDLNNAKLDIDHIADLATSVYATATDRFGRTKDTVIGAIETLKAFNNRGAWAATTVYAVKDLVSTGGAWYVCVVAHTSSPAFATDTASKWRLYQGITSGDLAAGVNVGTGPYYGAFSVHLTRTTIDRHAFEDWTTIETTSETGMGYSAFDAKVTMTNSTIQSHLVGYQSRNTYAGAGGLADYFHGYDIHMTHSGTGLVATAKGIDVGELHGAGPVTNNYGIFMSGNLRGTNPWTIYAAAGRCYLGAEVHTGIVLSNTQHSGIAYNLDVAGKDLSYGYGTAGFVNYGTHNFYDGKGGLVAKIEYNLVTITKGLLVGLDTRLQGKVELVSASVNKSICMGTGWVWTTDGLLASAIKGAIYAGADGKLVLSGGPALGAGIIVASDSAQVMGAFGANGVIPQPKYGVNANCTDLSTAIALINQLRAALINNGIGV